MKPRHLILIPILIIAKSPAMATFPGGYIHMQPVSCQSYTMKITVVSPYWVGSNVWSGYPEINFGDGVIESFNENTPVVSEKFSDRYGIEAHSVEHNYPGPGTYTISYRDFNRYANISNMDNSVNTPGYLETTFTIDPYLGCIETTKIENLSFYSVPLRGDFILDLATNANSEDSLHFSFEVPWQSNNEHVINYSYPSGYDETGQLAVSKLGIDPNNGLLYWPNANNTGNFVWDVRITQYRKLEGQVYFIGSTLVDLAVTVDSANENTPKIAGLHDTALVAGTTLKMPFAVQGNAQDEIKILSSGDVFQAGSPLATTGLSDTVYYHPPKALVLEWNTTAAQSRSKSYKFGLTAIEKTTGLMAYGSAYIWIVNQPSHPKAPSELQAFAAEASRVSLTWQDNSTDEAGFIVERADESHPGFIKIATTSGQHFHFYGCEHHNADPIPLSGKSGWHHHVGLQ